MLLLQAKHITLVEARIFKPVCMEPEKPGKTKICHLKSRLTLGVYYKILSFYIRAVQINH